MMGPVDALGSTDLTSVSVFIEHLDPPPTTASPRRAPTYPVGGAPGCHDNVQGASEGTFSAS
jgi:hypothetical protein